MEENASLISYNYANLVIRKYFLLPNNYPQKNGLCHFSPI